MDGFPFIIAAIGGYLLGSIPFGLFITRAAGLGDIRQIGSGNIGATNVLRTGRKDLALATLLLDSFKAGLAILGFALLFGDRNVGLIAGVFAFLGHCYPVWLRFKGGKGVAVIFGISLAMAPLISVMVGPLVFAVYYASRSWVWAFGAGIIAINVLLIWFGAKVMKITLCLVLSVLVVTTHFGSEYRELRQALRDRNWRKLGLLE